MARPRSIDETRLLKVAREVFVTRGAQATTREIADAAGVSQAVLFQRYRTKQRLFFAALLPTPPDLDDLVGDLPTAGAAAARAYLVGLATRLLAWIDLSMPGSLRAALHPDFPDAMTDAHAPVGASMIATVITERLKSLQERGDIPGEIAPAELTLALLNLLHGDALAALLSGESPDIRRRAERAVSALFVSRTPSSAIVSGGSPDLQAAKVFGG